MQDFKKVIEEIKTKEDLISELKINQKVNKKALTVFSWRLLAVSDLDRIQTCNLLSRNQMRYSVAPRGRCLMVCKYNTFLLSLKDETKNFTINRVFDANGL